MYILYRAALCCSYNAYYSAYIYTMAATALSLCVHSETYNELITHTHTLRAVFSVVLAPGGRGVKKGRRSRRGVAPLKSIGERERQGAER